MDRNTVILFVVLYMIVFAGVYHLFKQRTGSEFEYDKNSFSDAGVIISNVANDFGQWIRSISISKGVRNTLESVNTSIVRKFFPVACEFDFGFECVHIDFNSEQGDLLLILRNDYSRDIHLTGIDVTGGIECSTDMDEEMYSFKEVIMKIDDCEITGQRADLKVNFYYSEASEDFMKQNVGKIILE